MSLVSDSGKTIYKEFKEVTEAKTTREPKRYRKENDRRVIIVCWWDAFMPTTVATGLTNHALLGSSMA